MLKLCWHTVCLGTHLLLVFRHQNSVSSHSASFPKMLRICTSIMFSLRPPGCFSALTQMSSSRSLKSWCLHLCISGQKHSFWMWARQVMIHATHFSHMQLFICWFSFSQLLPSSNHPCPFGCPTAASQTDRNLLHLSLNSFTFLSPTCCPQQR